MLTAIKELRLRYMELMKKNVEYISIGEVVNALRQLESEARIKRLPKHLR